MLTIVIVCANVTNLLIARAVVRQREMAVRQSLGASRGRIVRGLLAEGLVLSVVAWIAACLFAWWVAKAVVPFLAPDAPGPVVTAGSDARLDGGRLRARRSRCSAPSPSPSGRRCARGGQQLLPFLKVGEQGVVQGRSRLTHGLVVLQLAFSVLLLTSAGLAHRSLSLQDSVDVGFDTSGVLLATVNTAAGGDDGRRPTRVLLEALRASSSGCLASSASRTCPDDGCRAGSTFPVRREAVRRVGARRRQSRRFRAISPRSACRSLPGAISRRSRRRAAVGDHHAAAGRRPCGRRSPRSARRCLPDPPIDPVAVEVIGVVENAYFTGRWP